MTDLSSPNCTALVAITSPSILISNSRFEGLNVSQDTLLYVANGSHRIQNSSFIGNQAAYAAAILADNMEQLTIQSSAFISNTGIGARILAIVEKL